MAHWSNDRVDDIGEVDLVGEAEADIAGDRFDVREHGVGEQLDEDERAAHPEDAGDLVEEPHEVGEVAGGFDAEDQAGAGRGNRQGERIAADEGRPGRRRADRRRQLGR